MLFLIPKNVTSERPIALMPTLIRWWEATRARCRVDWDATHDQNGAAQRTVWENLMEIKNPFRTNYSSIFPSKVQNLTVFSIIYMIRIRFFGSGESIQRTFFRRIVSMK